MHTLHCTHVKSHLTLQKRSSRPLWPVMMEDRSPTHKRRKLVKTYKNVLSRKRTVVAKVCRETYSKTNVIKWSRKTATDVINPANERETQRERERNTYVTEKKNIPDSQVVAIAEAS